MGLVTEAEDGRHDGPVLQAAQLGRPGLHSGGTGVGHGERARTGVPRGSVAPRTSQMNMRASLSTWDRSGECVARRARVGFPPRGGDLPQAVPRRAPRARTDPITRGTRFHTPAVKASIGMRGTSSLNVGTQGTNSSSGCFKSRCWSRHSPAHTQRAPRRQPALRDTQREAATYALRLPLRRDHLLRRLAAHARRLVRGLPAWGLKTDSPPPHSGRADRCSHLAAPDLVREPRPEAARLLHRLVAQRQRVGLHHRAVEQAGARVWRG